MRSKNKKSATFRLVQINRPREIEFSTSRRDYLCGNPNRVEILKVGETALGITAAAIRLIALSQPRPFPLYSNMFTYENDAPQVDAPRSPLPCSSGLLVFPVRGISISLSPSLFFDLLCILVPPLSSIFGRDNGIPPAHTFVTTVLLHPEIIRTVSLCEITGRANCFPLIRFHGTRVIKPSWPSFPQSTRFDVAFIFRRVRRGRLENGLTTIRGLITILERGKKMEGGREEWTAEERWARLKFR